jgi:hypothetical protein
MFRIRDPKSSSTGNVMLSSTLDNPDVKTVIKCVSTLLHSNLLDDMDDEKKIDPKSELYIFDEEKYIAENPSNFNEERITLLRKVPTPEDLSGFIDALYDIAQFSGECCVICLIYLNRIFALTSIPLLPTTWRPLILISLMIAQKMWDDKFLNNSDFITIYPFFDNEQLNKLELKFLELIQYNTHIKFSTYTKYYLELKSVEPDFPLKPMDMFTKAKLEHQSKNMEEKLKKNAKTSVNAKEAGQNTVYVIN